MQTRHRGRSRLRPTALALPALALAACGGAGDWAAVTQLDPAATAKRQAAERARDALAGELLAELGAALDAGGPAGGIRVCKERAPAIAAAVGKEQGVRIGRTSHRLRNPDNVPPGWAIATVAAKAEEPRFFGRDDGALAALFPIRLGPQCVQCHGVAQDLDPKVREALAAGYPQDRAVGFEPGQLRGWFWVEVP